MNQGPTVIVAGAGVLGLSTALSLAEAGCRVRVWDPAKEPQASAVAAGMLAPAFEAALDDADHDLDLLMAARDLWPGLAARTGIALDRSGTVAAGSAPWLAGLAERLTRLGVTATGLTRPSLDALTPGLAVGLEGFLVEEDWRLEPRPALAALRQVAASAGVEFRAQPCPGRDDADWLVVATGAGRDLLAAAPELERLAPIKGQILRYEGRVGGRTALRGEGAYAVPGSEGLMVGATMEAGRNDAEIDPAALGPLVGAAERLFPDLTRTAFSVSAGVRAATPDGLPMVGFSQAPGVILAVGARRNGWLLAPLVAEAVTACVMGRKSGPYAARLDPARFGAGRCGPAQSGGSKR